MKAAWLLSIPLAFAAGFATHRWWIEFRVEPLETNPDTTIGYIGCSNSSQAVLGYRLAGGTAMWEIPEGHQGDFDR